MSAYRKLAKFDADRARAGKRSAWEISYWQMSRSSTQLTADEIGFTLELVSRPLTP